MRNPHNIKVGQVLYDLDGNSWPVTQVGRIYFYIDPNKFPNKFRLDNLAVVSFRLEFRLYINEQEPLDIREKINKMHKIRAHFSAMPYNGNGITLEQVRQIYEVLNLHNKK